MRIEDFPRVLHDSRDFEGNIAELISDASDPPNVPVLYDVALLVLAYDVSKASLES
jgi:hypothetical protein